MSHLAKQIATNPAIYKADLVALNTARLDAERAAAEAKRKKLIADAVETIRTKVIAKAEQGLLKYVTSEEVVRLSNESKEEVFACIKASFPDSVVEYDDEKHISVTWA